MRGVAQQQRKDDDEPHYPQQRRDIAQRQDGDDDAQEQRFGGDVLLLPTTERQRQHTGKADDEQLLLSLFHVALQTDGREVQDGGHHHPAVDEVTTVVEADEVLVGEEYCQQEIDQTRQKPVTAQRPPVGHTQEPLGDDDEDAEQEEKHGGDKRIYGVNWS